MNTTYFHITGFFGLLLIIASALPIASAEFVHGVGTGTVLVSYITIIYIKRNKKNEATGR